MQRGTIAAIAMMIAGSALAGPSAAEKPPAELEAARAAFVAAVVKMDVAAATGLSALPLKNAVYRGPKSIPESKFGAQVKIYAAMKSCLKTAPLEPAPAKNPATREWMLDCDGNVLSFGLKNGRWLHTGYENINE